MDLNETICFCNDVTIGMIKDAVDSGAKTLEDVQAQTGAGTVCGGCLDNIQAVIDELTASGPNRHSWSRLVFLPSSISLLHSWSIFRAASFGVSSPFSKSWMDVQNTARTPRQFGLFIVKSTTFSPLA